MAQPRSAERVYMRGLGRVYRQIQSVVLAGLVPLLEVWPQPRGDRGPLTDAQYRELWPSLDPAAVRRFAPWATSRNEVERVLITAGRPIVGADLEDYVRASIRQARMRAPEADPTFGSRSSTRQPGAFQIRPQGRALPDPPVVLAPNGLPIGPPPTPRFVGAGTISEQFSWMRLNVGEMIREENLAPVLDSAGRTVNNHNARELGRVLAIDLRESVPGIRPLIDQWRGRNVGLIESSTLGPMDGIRLRPLLDDVSSVVENAHAQGLRVEEVAGQIQERFEVSSRRAELIARDQVLKLNAQINQHRQRSVGVTRYRWVAVGDERTRPRHLELDDSVQSWDSPPEVAPGRHEHPGGDYQCRCWSDPVLPDWLEG